MLARQIRPQQLISRLEVHNSQASALYLRRDRVIDQQMKLVSGRLERATGLLKSLSYHAVLARGFAVVRNHQGQPIRSATGLGEGDSISVQFQHDKLAARVDSKNSTGSKPGTKLAKQVKTKTKHRDQGSLF